MARARHDEPDEDNPDDWEESGGQDAEYDPDDPETDPQGLYDDDGPPMVPCPHCGAEVFEDSERCPRCEGYWSKEDAPTSRGGTWVILMILALLAAIILVAGK